MKKKNDKSLKPIDWTTKKLKAEYMGYYSMIYQTECFGVRDLVIFGMIEHALQERGVEILPTVEFK